MLAFIICWLGVFSLLVIGEWLRHLKLLKGEYHRKFIHFTVGVFAAFWPWILSWHQIQWLGTAMLAVVLINRYAKVFHFSTGIGREEYGDIFFALAIVACALLTDVKIFFALAILHVAIADAAATIVGKNFGKEWKYKVFHQTKTVLGSMTFWFVSVCLLATGVMLGAHTIIDFRNYAVLIMALPPILTVVENVSGLGLDNLSVPLFVILALHIAQTV